MKSKDLKALHTKDSNELRMLFDEARKALASLKLEHVQRKLKNTRSMYTKRKEIAKIQTVLQEKETEELWKKEGKKKV
ncbi:MAG: 50S ribosomal protein L29 [Candidatus Levybacteria bacterium]|nr:50S ribosomal protein L29 [Candidatus Levybacteria bacterium]